METPEHYPEKLIDHTFLDENVSGPKKGILIVLNRPIKNKKLFSKLLQQSEIIIGADGGANRIYKFSKENNINIKVDYIVGDFDSIKPEILSHYESKGSKSMEIKSQDLDDFGKAL